MRARVRHRGPDQGSTDVYGRCALGHQRLIVLDPATGEQPVANETGEIAAVFNGEIYNFQELRAELAARGHSVRGTGDTPVIPHLYEEHGPRFVERLHGMFTLALWDKPRDRLILARDRLGKKPLLWTRLTNGTLAFASELKALLELPEVARSVDLAALDVYLALGYVPSGLSAIGHVHKLAPAHILVHEREAVTVERYWEAQPRPTDALPDGDWLELVRETVSAAVRRRLAADVPLGALLSGGIDSSIVVGEMAKAALHPVRTFTVGFGDERYDERRYAQAVSHRWATEHEEVLVDPDVGELLPRLADTFDEPLADDAALPLFVVCEQARAHLTVALTGDGGDESFAGYERYFAHDAAARIPSFLARGASGALRLLPAARREPRSTLYRAARFLDAAATPTAERYGRLMELFPAPLRAELYTEDTIAALGDPASAAALLEAPPAEGVAGLQLIDMHTYLPDDLLLKADLASMAHSLELRSPLLDHEVIELGLALPDHLKFSGRTGKVALRRAFANDLPDLVAHRGKRGFGVPLSKWFRKELHDLAGDVLLDGRARRRGLFRPDAVEHLLAEHVDGRADHGRRLWALLMLELWQRRHVDAPASLSDRSRPLIPAARPGA